MEPSTYPRLSFLLPSDREEELPWVLSAFRIRGSEVEPRGEDMVRVTVYAALGESWPVELLEQELCALGAHHFEADELASRDWLASYREATRPFGLGRSWWIDPHPDSPTEAPAGRTRIAVEPRMAFGSGSHESTQLVLLELEECDLEGQSVLDVGTGSGILCLAALHRGAAWALGLDIDAQAVWVARQIARQQRPPQWPSFLVAELEAVGPGRFDLILCNMISEHFLPLLPALRRLVKPGGEVVFSGILQAQREDVRARLGAAGLAPVAERTLAEWLCLRVRTAP